MRSEKFGAYDRDQDDLVDLTLMQRNNLAYIKVVGQPLHVYIYSQEQLEILCKNFADEEDLTIHLDATGRIVRKPPKCNKKIFYYAGVIKTYYNKRIFPVLEFFSADQDAISIGMWLAKYKHFVISNKKNGHCLQGLFLTSVWQ